MTDSPRSITERIDGGYDVLFTGRPIGFVEEDKETGNFVGNFVFPLKPAKAPFEAESVDACALLLCVSYARRKRPYWDDGEGKSGRKRKKAKTKKVRGRKIKTLRDLENCLLVHRSVWWRGGPKASAFIMNQQFRTISRVMRSPNPYAGFFVVEEAEERQKPNG